MLVFTGELGGDWFMKIGLYVYTSTFYIYIEEYRRERRERYKREAGERRGRFLKLTYKRITC